jgi:hypothetical protein
MCTFQSKRIGGLVACLVLWLILLLLNAHDSIKEDWDACPVLRLTSNTDSAYQR